MSTAQEATEPKDNPLSDANIEKFVAEIADEPEGPESPETPAADTAAPVDETQAPPPADGKSRDPQGRFAKGPDQTPAQAPTAPAPASATPGPTTAPAQSTTAAPVRYRADGIAHELEGSSVAADGTVSISPQSWPKVQQALAAFPGLTRQVSQAAQRAKRAETERDAERQQRTVVFGKLEEMIEQAANGNEEPFLQWWADKVQNWRGIVADAQLQTVNALREYDRQELDELRRGERERVLGPQLAGHLEDLVQQMGKRPEFAGVNLQKMQQRLSRDLDRIFVVAPNDDPQGRWRKDEILVDEAFVHREFADFAEVSQGSASAAAAAIKTSERGTASSNAPPTVPATGAAPSTERKMPVPKTRKEADAFMARSLEKIGELVE